MTKKKKLTDQVFTAKVIVPPKKYTKTYYDYNEVASYLEKFHGKTFRDYANKYGKQGNENAPYQDFWHWICDCSGGTVNNGSFIYLPDISYVDDPETEDWKKEILQYFHDFLGDAYHEEMYVSW